jgi:hypothetical protein
MTTEHDKVVCGPSIEPYPVTTEHDGCGGMLIKINGWTHVVIHYNYRYTDNAHRAYLADRIVKILNGTDELSRLRSENERLKGELEQKDKLYKFLIRDTCDDDTNIRSLCRPFLGEFKTDHDGYAVISIVEVVENLIKHFTQTAKPL